MTDLPHAESCEPDADTLRQLAEIRDTGACNMMDMSCVQITAINTDRNALASFCGCVSTLGRSKRAQTWMDALRRMT